MMQEEVLQQEFTRLIRNCQAKRECLKASIVTRTRKKKTYAITAGVLSIAAAILLSAVVADLVPVQLIQFLSVMLAASGGVIAIYSSTLHNDDEVANIHAGSSKFLSVREKANYICLHKMDEEKALVAFTDLVNEYSNLSEVYDKYILTKITRSNMYSAGPSLEELQSSHPYRPSINSSIGPSTGPDINPHIDPRQRQNNTSRFNVD